MKNQHHFSVSKTGGVDEGPYKGADLNWCARMRCMFLSGCNGKGVSGDYAHKTCDYILRTGHMRPCPAGKGCTVCTSSKKATAYYRAYY